MSKSQYTYDVVVITQQQCEFKKLGNVSLETATDYAHDIKSDPWFIKVKVNKVDRDGNIKSVSVIK